MNLALFLQRGILEPKADSIKIFEDQLNHFFKRIPSAWIFNMGEPLIYF